MAELFLKQILFLLVAIFVGSLISALVFRALAKWLARVDIDYGPAYWTMVRASGLGAFLGVVAGIVVGASGGGVDALRTASYLAAALGILAQGKIFSSQLRIPYLQGLLITLAMVAIGLALGGVMYLLVGSLP